MTFSAEHPNRINAAAGFRGWLLALGVSLGTALLVIAPFFWLGNASGHDIGFHAASWVDVAGQWREGIVFPRWAEWANHGFGEPRFIFYPPLSWMLGAALSFVVPWNAVPGVFIIIAQTTAGLCSFALARRFLPVGAALFGAACYAANPYALLNVYMRSDFAELLACALMPVVVLTALQLCELARNRRGALPRAMAFFAVVFAAVWLSNAPAGVLASYSVAIIFAWAAVGEKSLRPLWRGAGGLALGFGLTSFYLLPAAYEQRWVNIAQALSSGLLPSQNFLYTAIDDPEHNLFNWIASSVAILLMVMTGIAGIAAHRSTAQEQECRETRGLWRVLLLLSAAAAILMTRLSSAFWEHLPELRFVQFPWRWMAILALPYGYFLAAAMARQRIGWIRGVLVLAVTLGTATFLVQKAWWDSEDFPVLQEAIANGQGFEGTDEYDPADDDHYNLPGKAPRVQIKRAESGNPYRAMDRGRKRLARSIARAAASGAAAAQLSGVARGGERQGRDAAARGDKRADDLVAFCGNAAHYGKICAYSGSETGDCHFRVTAKFVRTPDRKLGIAISVMALLTLLALLNAGGMRLLSASP